MKHNCIFFTVTCSILFMIGCNNDDFSPFRNFENNYVVYCVLDNRLKTQFVEIQKVFYPGMNKKLPGNTKVTLTELPDSNYNLKDTIITGREDYNVFYLDNFNLKRGESYRLDIKNDLFPEQFAEVTPPLKRDFRIIFDEWKSWDYKGNSITRYGFTFKFLNGVPNIYVYHLFYEYETSLGTGNIEVPAYLVGYPVYPSLSLVMSAPSSQISYWIDAVEYPLVNLQDTLITGKVKIKRGYLVLFSIDQNLYNYYSSENGYEDRFSIRLDRPYWTDMKTTTGQGIGLFGAVCTDTFSFKLPHDLIERYGLIDAQNY